MSSLTMVLKNIAAVFSGGSENCESARHHSSPRICKEPGNFFSGGWGPASGGRAGRTEPPVTAAPLPPGSFDCFPPAVVTPRPSLNGRGFNL